MNMTTTAQTHKLKNYLFNKYKSIAYKWGFSTEISYQIKTEYKCGLLIEICQFSQFIKFLLIVSLLSRVKKE